MSNPVPDAHKNRKPAQVPVDRTSVALAVLAVFIAVILVVTLSQFQPMTASGINSVNITSTAATEMYGSGGTEAPVQSPTTSSGGSSHGDY
jgi:hypothetical protein